ncbi:retrovirus-related pol polyprotein from transposon TNT 1-94 [Tanacetum coccineum]
MVAVVGSSLDGDETKDIDTYDSDYDDISNAKAVLRANISNYGSDVISEVPHSETYFNDMENQSVHAMQDFKQSPVMDFTDNEIHSYQNPFYLKKAQRIKPTLYDGIVISAKHVAMPVIDDEETLILEEESRSKMSEKEKDPEAIKQNISHKPIDYEKLNRLSDDFGKRFTPQQELSAEQAFWLRMSNPTSKPSDASPVKIEAPKELPKVSLVNESLKKLKFHLARFDNVVKIRTTPDARTEGEWGFEHTKAVFNNEIIPFLKSLKDIFNVFDKDLLNEIMKVQTVFNQMDSLDLDPLAPRLLQNMKAHIDYLKYTQEQADIFRGIELLVYVQDTCPNAIKHSGKKVLSHPKTMSRKLGLKCSTSNCISKPTGNKKNDRISRTPSRNMKNKVEAKPRKVNKKNRVVEPIRDVDVKHSLLKANSELISATCKNSMFDGVHDMCLLDFVENVVQIVLWYLDSRCSKHMIGNRSQLMNFVGHNLFFGGQISLDEMLKTSPICLLSKASNTKSWLWHRRLSHLNFGTLNKLAKNGLARGILRLKFQKDHLCSACALGKSKKFSHQPKAEDTNQEKLYLLHMDLCGLMRVASINKKSYILVFVDDYSKFTWVRFLRTKDEAPEAIIKCIKNIQVHLNANVRNVRTDNGTEFVNQSLCEFYENVGISHQTSVARTPQQNGIVERRN